MRLSDWDQRLLDQESGKHLDALARERRRKVSCKHAGAEVRADGGCLGCDADAGERCEFERET